MSNGTGPIPERPQDFNLIMKGEYVKSGQYKGCIKTGDGYYWLSRRPEAPYYWVHNLGNPNETMVPMSSEVWDKCKDGGKYVYKDWLAGWVDSEQVQWRWDGQPGNPIFVSNDFEL